MATTPPPPFADRPNPFRGEPAFQLRPCADDILTMVAYAYVPFAPNGRASRDPSFFPKQARLQSKLQASASCRVFVFVSTFHLNLDFLDHGHVSR